MDDGQSDSTLLDRIPLIAEVGEGGNQCPRLLRITFRRALLGPHFPTDNVQTLLHLSLSSPASLFPPSMLWPPAPRTFQSPLSVFISFLDCVVLSPTLLDYSNQHLIFSSFLREGGTSLDPSP